MRSALPFLLALAPFAAAQDASPTKSPLRLLYVAEPGDDHALRMEALTGFLAARCTRVEVVRHGELDPLRVARADVVLLDWHQGGDRSAPSPLGARDAWTKPTVLLGSAGLNNAKAWEALGGSG